MIVVVRFSTTPAHPLSENESRSMHWAARNRRLDPWKHAARAAATDQGVPARVAGRACRVQVVIPFTTRHRRDPHNYTGTVVKAVVDGLVRAEVWPDDTPEWVEVIEPRLVIGGSPQVRIEPKEVRRLEPQR